METGAPRGGKGYSAVRRNALVVRHQKWMRFLLLATVIIAFTCLGASLAKTSAQKVPALPMPCKVRFLESGWSLGVTRKMPEPVVSLLAYQHDQIAPLGRLYVGTGGIGNIHFFAPELQSTDFNSVALGLGDRVKFGSCEVSALAMHDLDGDGVDELVATTSQITPRGQPRVYVWSIPNDHILRAFTRLDIRSSWSHGIAYARSATKSVGSLFSSFCGFGEVVELRLGARHSTMGFHADTLEWKTVGQLPASGEQIFASDVDNDGMEDLCIATGYSVSNAAIQIYGMTDRDAKVTARYPEPLDRPAMSWTLVHNIDEEKRFANVRFLVLDHCQPRRLLAWWTSDITLGECEIILYELDEGGVRERTLVGAGQARDLWPTENQISLGDLDHDGVLEVWFASGSGHLWRFHELGQTALVHVCTVETGLGPISAGPRSREHRKLYLGWKNFVFDLQRPRDPNRANNINSKF